MKGFFGFYQPSDSDFQNLWKDGTLFLDANVLLNMYRYSDEARSELFEVLKKFVPRIHLPYHAALEYQRNRLNVIAEQKRRFVEVKKLVATSTANLESELSQLQLRDRHALIDPDAFLDKLKPIVTSFQDELSLLEKKQINVHENDPIRSDLDKLFSGHTGAAPDQTWITNIESEGKTRYERRIPPGYKDDRKSDGVTPTFSYGGISYSSAFGDLTVWKQIIEHCKSQRIHRAILLTDDTKEDWWWTHDSLGPKRIGPRPELVDEIKREAGVDTFFMYTTSQFLTYAKESLKASVSDRSIEAVKEATAPNLSPAWKAEHGIRHSYDNNRPRRLEHTWDIPNETAEMAVYYWASYEHKNAIVALSDAEWPGIVVYLDTKQATYGIETLIHRRASAALTRVREAIYRAFHALNKKQFETIEIVNIFEHYKETGRIQNMLEEEKISLPANVILTSGFFEDENFIPTARMVGPA